MLRTLGERTWTAALALPGLAALLLAPGLASAAKTQPLARILRAPRVGGTD